MKKQLSGIFAAFLCVPLLFFTACGGTAASGQDADSPSAPSAGAAVVSSDGYDSANACVISYSSDGAAVSGSGAAAEGSAVTISAAGTYKVSGSCADGSLWVSCEKEDEVTVILAGLDLQSAESCPFVVEHGLVTLVLEDGTENSLSDAQSYSLAVTSDETNVDGALFCKDDLTITGSGALTITGGYKHGVVCKDALTIESGSLAVTAAEDGFQANDGITVSGGAVTISAGDDGMHSDDFLTVTGGAIDVLSSYEGLEGANITISGGDIRIKSSDDGLNAAGGDDGSGGMWSMAGDATKSILIEGGYLVVDAEGDGVDSNGSLTVTGGVTLVSGPVSSANGAVDYGTEASISGGVFMAFGASGMAESFGESSAQGSIMVNVSGTAGETVALCDESGSVLCSFTPAKQYGNIVISCPGIEADGTYTICTGTVSGADENGYAQGGAVENAVTLTTVTLSGLRYAEGGMMGGMGGFGGGKGGRGDWDGTMPEGMTPPDGATMPEGTPPDGFGGMTRPDGTTSATPSA